MVRRMDVLHEGLDQRIVRWWLLAATIALSLGLLAEAVQRRSDVAQKPTPVDTTAVVTRADT